MKCFSEFCCVLTLFHSNLGSRGGKYSGLTGAEICKKYRESMTEAKKEKERIKKQRGRGEILRRTMQIIMNILRKNVCEKIIPILRNLRSL